MLKMPRMGSQFVRSGPLLYLQLHKATENFELLRLLRMDAMHLKACDLNFWFRDMDDFGTPCGACRQFMREVLKTFVIFLRRSFDVFSVQFGHYPVFLVKRSGAVLEVSLRCPSVFLYPYHCFSGVC